VGMDSFGGPAGRPDPEDPAAALVALTPRLRALDDIPAPDAAFVRRLEEALMRNHRAATAHSAGATIGLTTTMNGRAPVIASRQPTSDALRRGRWWLGAQLAAVAVLLLMVAGLAATRWGDAPNDGGRPRGAAIPAPEFGTPGGTSESRGSPMANTTAPIPEDCRVAPRPIEDFAALLGTAPNPITPAAEGWAGYASLGDEPAGAAIVEAVGATASEVIACVNAGDPRRQYALYTDDALRRLFLGIGNENLAFFAATPTPLLPDDWQTPIVRDVGRLDDGRIGATAEVGGTTAYLVFVELGGRYLIDDVIEGVPVADDATPAVASDQRPPWRWIATSDATDETEGPTVSLLLIVDRSGSMTYDPLGRTSKIEMAKEALRLAAGALAEGDQVGILAFNDQQEWLVELTTLDGPSTRADVEAAIDRLTAEGGTELLPALALGLDAIRAVDADARHVVFLSDGKSRTGTREDYQSLIDDATANGVTLSTIAIGDDADADLLRFLADEGGGAYHVAVNPAMIPTFALEEAQGVSDRRTRLGASGASDDGGGTPAATP